MTKYYVRIAENLKKVYDIAGYNIIRYLTPHKKSFRESEILPQL